MATLRHGYPHMYIFLVFFVAICNKYFSLYIFILANQSMNPLIFYYAVFTEFKNLHHYYKLKMGKERNVAYGYGQKKRALQSE